jgi:hypothetical protein
MAKARFSFLLFEVFLAIALLALCLIPIASSPFRNFIKQSNALKQMELERLSDVAYKDLLNILPSITTFDSLPTTKNESTSYDLGTYKFDIEECGTYSYLANFRFWIVDPKDATKIDNYCLIQIELTFTPEEPGFFTPNSFTYNLFIKNNKDRSKEKTEI